MRSVRTTRPFSSRVSLMSSFINEDKRLTLGASKQNLNADRADKAEKTGSERNCSIRHFSHDQPNPRSKSGHCEIALKNSGNVARLCPRYCGLNPKRMIFP